ncbi:hypothetical protein FSARC_14788 [Fusarium sarcochroum]|uniref:Uncharacterized protein n=1 Tax=Fusarium sarcochroum TaxID=1208366 RepID=A0A8H4SQU6_9HYPO|nr:hypothetical protein FSARC_14788 [Fusarium sarcochroum]
MADNIKSLLGDNAVSANEAAQKLASRCIDAVEKNDNTKIEDELDGLWSNILAAAEQTPHDKQDKLVDILHAIKHLSQPAGKKLEIWGQEQRWDELPTFGAKAREQLDSAQEKSGEPFVNINGFFARVTAAGVNDLSLFAIWVLREALEDPSEDKIAQQTSSDLLKAASVWFKYAAKDLAKASKETKQFDGKIAKPGASLSALKDEPGWRGFCEDRWKIWQTRLTSLKNADVQADAKSLVLQALDNIEKV